MILHGDVPTEAEREDLNEWVTIDPATKHAGAILDGTGITMAVPRFYSTYSYSGNHITELSHSTLLSTSSTFRGTRQSMEALPKPAYSRE